MAARKPQLKLDDHALVKKPFQKFALEASQEAEFLKCAISPIYFIENYVKIKHATKGDIPFKLFDFQKELIEIYWNYKDSIAMCSRQMGKCIIGETVITKNGEELPIERLIVNHLSFRDRIIHWLEKKLISLYK